MISPLRIIRPPLPCSRERSLARIQQYKLASAKTEEIAKQLGIPVPVLVC